MNLPFDSFFSSDRRRTLRIVCRENPGIRSLLNTTLEDIFSVFIKCVQEEMRTRGSTVTLETEIVLYSKKDN
jgi:hypothetical protein